MIEHIWSVVCGSTSIDKETNTISIFNVMEQITVFTNETKPFRLPAPFEIVSLWSRKNESTPCQGKMRLYYCDTDQNYEKQQELLIDLNEGIFYRTRVRFHGIELKGQGLYKFFVDLQQSGNEAWNRVATIPVLVIYQPEMIKK